MSKVLVVLVAVLMLAAGGVVEIAQSGRTASDKQVNEAKAKLAAIPLRLP